MWCHNCSPCANDHIAATDNPGPAILASGLLALFNGREHPVESAPLYLEQIEQVRSEVRTMLERLASGQAELRLSEHQETVLAELLAVED